jgi:hypothetical protein
MNTSHMFGLASSILLMLQILNYLEEVESFLFIDLNKLISFVLIK